MRQEVSIRPNGTKRILMHCDQPSRTRQEFKAECDLGLTIRRFCKTHEGREALKNAQGYAEGCRFEDVSGVPTLQTIRDIIIRGKVVFEALPAVLRKRFDNDAAKYLDFVHDPANLAEMRAMGLAKPEVANPVKPVDSGVSTPPVKA